MLIFTPGQHACRPSDSLFGLISADGDVPLPVPLATAFRVELLTIFQRYDAV